MRCEHLVPGHVTHGRVANPGHECERVLCWPTLIKQIGLALNIEPDREGGHETQSSSPGGV